MFHRGKVVWSPCELDWLKENRSERSINELSLYLSKSRNAVQNKLDEFDGKEPPAKKNGKGTKIGKREDILVNGKPAFFRSGWEANVARMLNHQKAKWEYEPDVFIFDGIKHGTVSYCPDFKVKRGRSYEYLEIKGFLDSKGRVAIKRFKKYHPDEFKKLKAIVGSPGSKTDLFFKKLGVPILGYMRDFNKEFKKEIENWE